MEDAGRGATGGEEDVVLVGAAEDHRGVAGGEKAFGGKCGGLGALREFGPVFAVFGVEDGEFAVDGIADCEAILFGATDEAVQEERRARVGILYLPGAASIRCLINVRFILGADGVV